jgi:mevalonate kinase
MTLEASACAKCVLFGEHSVLYGSGAITLPLKELKMKVLFAPGPKSSLSFSSLEIFPEAEELFWKLLAQDFSQYSTHGHYEIKSEIPIGAGLGSSAALSVALHKLFNPEISKKDLIERAWKSENFFHGRSSGMDPCTIALEEILFFQSPSHYEVLDFQLPQDYVLVLHDSKVRRRALSAIEKQKNLDETNPAQRTTVIQKLQAVVLEAKSCIQRKNFEKLALLMNQSHELLEELQVSTEKLEDLRKKLLELGALGVKLTGAGMGGFLISLFRRSCWDLAKTRDSAQIHGPFFELRV